MNKRGGTTVSEVLMSNAIYIILVVLFFLGMLTYIGMTREGSTIWQEYYAKEITKVIDLAKPGDEVVLDIQKGSAIGKRNEVKSFTEMFQIYNENKEVCVKLNKGRATCYYFFNDVNVVGTEIVLGVPENELKFKVVSKEEENG